MARGSGERELREGEARGSGEREWREGEARGSGERESREGVARGRGERKIEMCARARGSGGRERKRGHGRAGLFWAQDESFTGWRRGHLGAFFAVGRTTVQINSSNKFQISCCSSRSTYQEPNFTSLRYQEPEEWNRKTRNSLKTCEVFGGFFFLISNSL